MICLHCEYVEIVMIMKLFSDLGIYYMVYIFYFLKMLYFSFYISAFIILFNEYNLFNILITDLSVNIFYYKLVCLNV